MERTLLSAREKIMLLDEVVSTATASWRIYIAADHKFSDWPESRRDNPAYTGYTTIKALLSHSLMSALYASMEPGKHSYSMRHAVEDPELIVTPTARNGFKCCLLLWPKIAIYRNNVTAHVNTKRKQTD
jgi:hypothetical protein